MDLGGSRPLQMGRQFATLQQLKHSISVHVVSSHGSHGSGSQFSEPEPMHPPLPKLINFKIGSTLSQDDDAFVPLFIGAFVEKESSFEALEIQMQLAVGMRQTRDSFLISINGQSRPIRYITSFDWAGIKGSRRGLASPLSTSAVSRVCYRCGFFGSDKQGGWFNDPLAFSTDAPAPAPSLGADAFGAAAAAGLFYFLLCYLKVVDPIDDTYDAAHGCARLASNVLCGIWRYLLSFDSSLALNFIESICIGDFPITVSSKFHSITLVIKFLKMWFRSGHSQAVLDNLDARFKSVTIFSWSAAEEAAVPVTIFGAVSELFRCLQLFHDLIWGFYDPERLYDAWIEARTGLLCHMYGFNMVMHSASHYMLNHVGTDIEQHYDIASMICEGTERQNEFQSSHARALISSQEPVAQTPHTKSTLQLRHKQTLLICKCIHGSDV